MPKTHHPRHTWSVTGPSWISVAFFEPTGTRIWVKTTGVRMAFNLLIGYDGKKHKDFTCLHPPGIFSSVLCHLFVVADPQDVPCVITWELWFQQTWKSSHSIKHHAELHTEKQCKENTLCLTASLYCYNYPFSLFCSELFECYGKQYNKNINQSLTTS